MVVILNVVVVCLLAVFGLGPAAASPSGTAVGLGLETASHSIIILIKRDKNDDDDDEHHHGKGNKKKNTNGGATLSECTIQQSGGGGGCKGDFKRVCEKMKSGKKCCGCVPDKSMSTTAGQSAPTEGGGKTSSGGIKPIDEVPPATLLLPYFECDLSKGPCNMNGQK